MILTDTSSKIRGKLGGAADPAPTFHVSYEDVDQNGKRTYGGNQGAFNGTTEVDIVDSPPEATTRRVLAMSIHNGDNAAVTATLEHYNGTTARSINQATLQTLENLFFSPEAGYKATDTDGDLKNTT